MQGPMVSTQLATTLSSSMYHPNERFLCNMKVENCGMVRGSGKTLSLGGKYRKFTVNPQLNLRSSDLKAHPILLKNPYENSYY